jgi:hypothetical protein
MGEVEEDMVGVLRWGRWWDAVVILSEREIGGDERGMLYQCNAM